MRKNTIFILAVAILFGVVSPAGAETSGAVINNIQVSVSGTQPQLNSELKFGMRGDEVKMLQRMLASEPDIYPSKLVTGFLWPAY